MSLAFADKSEFRHLRRLQSSARLQYAVLSALLTGLLVHGVAGSQAPAEPDYDDQSLLLVMDASGSMTGKIGQQRKMAIARDVVYGLVDELPAGTEVGLMAYGHRSPTRCDDIEMLIAPSPLDKQAFKARVNSLKPKGMTPLTAAAKVAIDLALTRKRHTTVIVISDGLDTCKASPCEMVKQAKAKGADFVMHVVGFDLEGQDVKDLKCAAEASGGKYFAAKDAGQLAAAVGTATVAIKTPTLDPFKPMPDQSVTTNASLTLGKQASLMLDARSDVYSGPEGAANAKRGGFMPSIVTLASGGGYVTFGDIHGRIGCSRTAAWGPDGGGCAGGITDLEDTETMSGIVHRQRTLFVAGVFAGAPAQGTAPPPRLDFSDAALGSSFPKLEPKLGQMFFIGDGLMGTGDGSPQHFIIPEGATTLYLGFADGWDFRGTPGYYADNKGSVAIHVTQER
ncbi:MAG TPA: VWA domain-containing protein [Polyangiales bacterium]|nr:VWA domain-containing protein [Polyangiales bacterium]